MRKNKTWKKGRDEKTYNFGEFNKECWTEEIQDFREAIQDGRLKHGCGGHSTQRQNERNISDIEIALVILQGKIVEGYDIGDADFDLPVRTIVGEVNGRLISVWIKINPHYQYEILTVYPCDGKCGKRLEAKYYAA